MKLHKTLSHRPAIYSYAAALSVLGLTTGALAIATNIQAQTGTNLNTVHPAPEGQLASLHTTSRSTTNIAVHHPVTGIPVAEVAPVAVAPAHATTTATQQSSSPTHVANGAPAAVASNTGQGLFLQVSSLSPTYSVADVAHWMAQVCSTGKSTAGPTLVLQDIVNASGQFNTPYLNAIMPYLPGYSSCFSQVFIGTAGINYNGPGTLYQQGVQNTSLQSDYLNQSAALANEFLANYPRVRPNWYLTLEANLNYLDQPAVATAYSSILTNQIRYLQSLTPKASFLWSPGFWYTYTGYSSYTYGMGLLNQGLAGLFSNLATATHQPVIIDLQDEIGTTNCWGSGAMTPLDAVDWEHYLTTIPNHPTIEMNTTLFQTSCSTGGAVPLSANQVNTTESYYQSNNVKLGPAYEMRYWLQQHGMSLTTQP